MSKHYTLVCPDCRQTRVWFSDSFIVHILRAIKGSRKRYCRSCRSRWTDHPIADSTIRSGFFISSGALLLGAVICLASGVSMNPVEWFKGQVVSHYDKTYGKDAKKKIWEDLGGFYNTKKGAMTDFNDHR